MKTPLLSIKPHWPIAWTVIILAYLGVEWVYNQHLMQLLQYPSVTPAQFEWTEMFGKAIASVGLNLVLCKCYRRPSAIKFAVGVCVAYAALTWVFNTVIESFPDQFRHSSYYGVIQRKDVVNGTDEQQRLAFTKNAPWYVESLVLSQYYLTLQDKQWSRIERTIRAPLEKKTNAALGDRKALWSLYTQAEEARQYMDVGWEQYREGMARYNRYRNDPRHAERARQTFLERAGVPPDLTKDQFIEAKAKKYHDYLTKVMVPGNPEFGVATIRGRDIPLRMDEKAFNRYLNNTVNEIRTAVAPEARDIRGNEASKDAVALLVIPPLSIGLSLLSIGVNLVGLVCAWISALVPAGTVRRVACALVCLASIGGATAAYMHQPHAIRTNEYWAQLDTTFEQSHPIVWAAMSIPMRLEPILCTNAPVQWIGNGMQVLYRPEGVQAALIRRIAAIR